MTAQERLDALLPPRGPCAFCGADDARHRLLDALRGDDRPAAVVAHDYGVALELVLLAREMGHAR